MNASPAYAITAYTGACALGMTRDACLSALYAGRSGLAVSAYAEPLQIALGALPDALPDLPATLRAYDTQLARMAVLLTEPMQAQLSAAIRRHGASRVGIVVASSTGGLAASEQAFRAASSGLPDRYSFERSHAFYALVQVLRVLSGARGAGYVVSTACSSGNKVFGCAQRLLSAGVLDAVLVGGIDTLCQVTVRGFHSLGILSAQPCRPFARERDGTSIGEGGALFLIERGVDAAVALCGVGECSDAHHMTQPAPDGSGAAAAMRLALEDAGLDASQIDHVNAHGTGTPLNDASEARAIAAVLGTSVPVASTKGATGHMLGAAAAMEALFALAAIERGQLPQSLGCDPRDPAINLAVCDSARARLSLRDEQCARVRGQQRQRDLRSVHMTLCVLGVGLWPAENAGQKPAAALLPARMRGRASPLTLMLAEVADQAARSAGVSLPGLPSVFGSAYGEMNTTASLLSQLWAADGQLSPAKFQASVHNTAAGQLSIALHNPSFTTSIAAGHDTVAMCLIEARAWLARHPGQIIVACADEAPNAVLQPGAAYPPLAAAFVLDNVAQRGIARIVLEQGGDVVYEAAPPENPVGSAVALARAILQLRESSGASSVTLNPAAPHGYRVSVEPVTHG